MTYRELQRKLFDLGYEFLEDPIGGVRAEYLAKIVADNLTKSGVSVEDWLGTYLSDYSHEGLVIPVEESARLRVAESYESIKMDDESLSNTESESTPPGSSDESSDESDDSSRKSKPSRRRVKYYRKPSTMTMSREKKNESVSTTTDKSLTVEMTIGLNPVKFIRDLGSSYKVTVDRGNSKNGLTKLVSNCDDYIMTGELTNNNTVLVADITYQDKDKVEGLIEYLRDRSFRGKFSTK